jgi:hypothetical protein
LVPYDRENLPDLAESLPRAYADIVGDLKENAGIDEDVAGQLLSDPVSTVELFERVIQGHVKRARIHMLRLAPYLAVVYQRRLWSVQGAFRNFHEWVEYQGISYSRANDLVDWYTNARPQLEAAGIPEERIAAVDESKWRNTTKWFKEKEEPLEPEEVERIVQVLESSTYREVLEMTKSPGTHEPEEQIAFTVVQSNGSYMITARLTVDQMRTLERRVRPMWLNKVGQILKFPKEE